MSREAVSFDVGADQVDRGLGVDYGLPNEMQFHQLHDLYVKPYLTIRTRCTT